MHRKSFAGMRCSIARALEIVGEWWSLLVLRECFRGAKRFDDFQKALPIATNILSARLAKLVTAGVLRRERSEDDRRRHEYRLTDKGRDLYPILIALMHWGDRWEAGPNGPPVVIVERATGRPIAPMAIRNQDGRALDPREVQGIRKGTHA